MTHPDDSEYEEGGLDARRLADARSAEADEADLIEQATAIPMGDDERGLGH